MQLLEFVACASAAAAGRGAVAFHVRVGDGRESVNEGGDGHELAAGVGEACCWRVGGRVGAAVQAVVVARGGEQVEVVAGRGLFGRLEGLRL